MVSYRLAIHFSLSNDQNDSSGSTYLTMERRNDHYAKMMKNGADAFLPCDGWSVHTLKRQSIMLTIAQRPSDHQTQP
jgi:hypothetical protein